MKSIARRVAIGSAAAFLSLVLAAPSRAATNYILLGWSEEAMHFMENDYSVFAIHPPGNTIHAQVVQLIDGNLTRLLTNPAAGNITVTLEAAGDPDGSTNSTSRGKSNFWEFSLPLFGTNLPPDAGLGSSMPGTSNTPQALTFDASLSRFTLQGLPVTPYDDRGRFNPYPLFKLVAYAGGTAVTNIRITAGVTDEMDCRLCHASGSSTSAAPSAGWVFDPNPARDYRLNILRLHDQRQATNPVYAAALSAKGFNAGGLFAHVRTTGQPILCGTCHASAILPGSGYGSIKPLTQAIHAQHATVIDPRDGSLLDSETNRATCYTCHGGAITHFLRGAMGTADTTSGQLAIQCQSCHGSMALVGATNRIGWLSEPNCQACHVGDALNTVGGQIRFTTALTSGVLRTPANNRFAANANTPSNGMSLFRLSKGHGSLQCAACHGPAHAEFPSAVANDNLRSLEIQGHTGVMAECNVCHGTQTLGAGNGPHGMHPHDMDWADGSTAVHPDASSDAACGPCHGTLSDTSARGTILSQARADRGFGGLKYGDITMWKGQTIGCTHCHNSTAAPTVTNTAATTLCSVPVTFTLGSSTNNVRIVTQPLHGLVALSNKTATYTPEPGFIGTDTFTFASVKPQKESTALGVGTVVVTEQYSVADGVPVWWRKLHFGGSGTTTDALSCATCDPDGDGMGNRQEFRAGTDPRNARSRLVLFTLSATGGAARLGFDTVVTRQYVIEATTNAITGPWQPASSETWGRTISTLVTTSNGPTGNAALYRVGIR